VTTLWAKDDLPVPFFDDKRWSNRNLEVKRMEMFDYYNEIQWLW